MKVTKRTVIYLCLCCGIFIICFILISMLSGYRYELKKLKQFVLTLIAILFVRYILLDHIVFLLQALFLALNDKLKVFATQVQEEVEHEAQNDEINPMELLKIRLEIAKSQLKLTPRHKNEALNCKFKQLSEEFWLFGKYFFLLLLLVVCSRNSFTYYNTAVMRRILNESYFSSYKMGKVLTISDLYFWINNTLTAALNEGYDYDGRRIDEPGWLNFHQSKLLGVVRLHQVRHGKKENSMTRLYFDEQNYVPGWKKLNKSLHYMDKYWRIYYPWLAKHTKGISSWLMRLLCIGSIYRYSENYGYVVFLARDQRNSEKILNFLKAKKWLDAQTAGVFMDFTLYNTDSNIFTICSILVEQTPFGSLLWHINVHSAELLWNINEISMWFWLLIVLYAFQMLQFCKVMILRAWFMSAFFKSRWNCVDLTIVVLNVILLVFILLREYYVKQVIQTFVMSKKQEYVDFRVANVFNYTANVILGFLICLAFIRIWKVLQFSSIFRVFNRTLYNSCVPLISTIFGIYIFLCAIGKSAQILNSGHSEIFTGYLKSITSIMSFSFGFNSATSPDDLSYGGDIFGFILYLILMFVVAIFLVNMFITLICDHFSNARQERDREPFNKLTFWQFLNIEYSFIIEFFRNIFLLCNKTKNQTVSENISDYLDELDKRMQEECMQSLRWLELTEKDHVFDAETKITERIKNVAGILNLQLEILEHLIMFESFYLDSEHDSS